MINGLIELIMLALTLAEDLNKTVGHDINTSRTTAEATAYWAAASEETVSKESGQS